MTVYENGTLSIIIDFVENNLAGSELLFALIILGVLIMMLMATRMPPKFIMIFSIIGFFSFFAPSLPSYVSGGQYSWIFFLIGFGVVGYFVYMLIDVLWR